MAEEIGREEIEEASRRIRGLVRRTPILDAGDALSTDFDIVLKLEHLQVTGSFKPRGAFSLLTSAEIPDTGVVAASGGNFGIAVAHAAATLGHRATIFVPATSPRAKIDRISAMGAEVNVIPGFYDEALTASREFAHAEGTFVAHAYDQRAVVAGQGTIAKEFTEECSVDHVVVAVGGGGLIGGIASWVRDEVTVVAAEPETCRSLNASLAAGRQVEVDVSGVAASSLGARSVGDHAWLARRWIDYSVVVPDSAIVDAQGWLWDEFRLAVEPAAATTVAVLATGAFSPPKGSRVLTVLSGANVSPGDIERSLV
jgi:threonine dehydratase